MAKIAIHGFGRIGRSTLKAALQNDLFSPISVSDIRDAQTFAALFAADSNYGRWHEPVESTDTTITIGGREIQYINTSESLPDWGALGVDLVIDCTGRATVRSGAQAHLDRGAKKVLISAASKSKEDCDAMLLLGINAEDYKPDQHHIISMASCTTNALAPVVKILRNNFGIEYGLFSTVHAYTNTQSLSDQPMKDRRDSWAAAENIIPSSSGAAKALVFIWEDLQMTGKAYRVPVRTGSIAEINAVLKQDVTKEQVVAAFEEAAQTEELQGVMGLLYDEWASARIVGDPHSSIIDMPLINVIGNRLVSVAAWYDNEMGYSTRLAEMASFLSR
ncbi:aldehyde dehydrogenase [Phototrophicus methaneseepsis]|uniref:Aldehyde dehydrogenase n=1 Tax=Phototrophicus methaneseepsis TaxID=2710758 RepID=A0A7S8IEN2_9CHLR|nr:glyceraldehyde 3-phosphate dehydrogenase NAD-binding domain-containing protein [Phototrophicus methaneseepsis]QPC83865.1 aldehyde dehydrogenase [Phototrophicus methaneseepsis]